MKEHEINNGRIDLETQEHKAPVEKDICHTEWVVITGPPSSGKSTMVEDLKYCLTGYTFIPEVAREIIKDDIQRGINPQPTSQYAISLNHRIFSRRKQIEELLDIAKPVLMDRGTPDIQAYARYYGEDENYIANLTHAFRYKKVLYMEPLGIFTNDAERLEDEEFANVMNGLLPEVYQDSGYNLIRVLQFPFGEGVYTSNEERKKDSILQRRAFILKNLT